MLVIKKGKASSSNSYTELTFLYYCCPVKLKYHINPCGIAFI